MGPSWHARGTMRALRGAGNPGSAQLSSPARQTQLGLLSPSLPVDRDGCPPLGPSLQGCPLARAQELPMTQVTCRGLLALAQTTHTQGSDGRTQHSTPWSDGFWGPERGSPGLGHV